MERPTTTTNMRIIPFLATHTHTLILLHGRDSTAEDFHSELFEFESSPSSAASQGQTLASLLPGYKFIFPAAPLLSSARFQTPLSQWFDIWSVSEPEERPELQFRGLKESVKMIREVVRREAEIVGRERVVLGGISVGCATALVALLTAGERLGGFVGVCGWLPCRGEVDALVARFGAGEEALREMRGAFGWEGGEHRHLGFEVEEIEDVSDSVLQTAVFLAHCKDDEVVPIRNGEKMCESLEKLGMAVTWKAYEDGGHWVNEPQGVDDVVAFLQKIM
jgi:predicted esterase